MSQVEVVQEEGLRRVISESNRRSTENLPVLLERSKSNSVSAQLKHAKNGFEELEIKGSIEPHSENIVKTASFLLQGEEAKEFASPKVRRSNNIWSLVQQKKGQQPSNGQESPILRMMSSPSSQANFKLCEPSPGPIAKAIRIFESPPLMSRESGFSSPKKLVLGEKDCEINRKSLKLSIKIPEGSPLQGSPGQSQIRELPQPVTLESAKGGIIKAGPLRLSISEQPGDSNMIPTTKTAAKKEFTFTNLVFENKSPKSPSRSLWVPQFLKGKLGKEKYEKVLSFLERSNQPAEIIKEQPELVLDIIGEENRECLVMLSFLMSYNSPTPTANKDVEWPRDPERKNSLSSKTPKRFNIFPKNIFPTSAHSPNRKFFLFQVKLTNL